MAAQDKKKKSDKSLEQPSKFAPAQISQFVTEVKAEFFKVVWPDRKVTMGLTGIVIVFAFVAALYLGAVDLVLGKLVSSILR
ncbi:MAG: preprotein translocase subunit SecE [Desulfobulbaceae bacterium]|uniref:Protein translocase subunit SecE n=1 Tax=Candidatus Desulfatifera sulfidica TaxID=2841691 RepID=A0A8J6N8E1_9BACT|nr:preprotein translocase subunit SecE [Candidatus Desulfatifera sulfidica]